MFYFEVWRRETDLVKSFFFLASCYHCFCFCFKSGVYEAGQLLATSIFRYKFHFTRNSEIANSSEEAATGYKLDVFMGMFNEIAIMVNLSICICDSEVLLYNILYVSVLCADHTWEQCALVYLKPPVKTPTLHHLSGTWHRTTTTVKHKRLPSVGLMRVVVLAHNRVRLMGCYLNA